MYRIYRTYLTLSPRAMVAIVGLLITFSGFAMPEALAQSEPNQSYDCGSYGAGEFGQNDCVVASESTPTPTPASAGGDMPSTGASLSLWAAIGALAVAAGLGLYGYSRRSARRLG